MHALKQRGKAASTPYQTSLIAISSGSPTVSTITRRGAVNLKVLYHFELFDQPCDP